MRPGSSPLLNPRKSPRQGRSIATVNAIFEATLQVLRTDGPARLNTTRVARRAGVSVGTLYQYFPNKQALLFAALERHLAMLADAIEQACDEHRHEPLEAMAAAVVRAYVQTRMVQAEVTPALYLVTRELDVRPLAELATQRSERAIEAMLATVSEGQLSHPHVIAQTLTAAIYGTVPAFCPRVLSLPNSREAERQLTVMFHSYLLAQQSGTAETESAP